MLRSYRESHFVDVGRGPFSQTTVCSTRLFCCLCFVVSNGVMYLLWGDASVAKVMQFVLQSLQVPRGLQEVLGEDLLLLPGVGGHGDGVPDLNQDGLIMQRGGAVQFSSGLSCSLDLNQHFKIGQRSAAQGRFSSFPICAWWFKQQTSECSQCSTGTKTPN